MKNSKTEEILKKTFQQLDKIIKRQRDETSGYERKNVRVERPGVKPSPGTLDYHEPS